MQYGVVTVDGLIFENIHSTYNILIPLTHYDASGSAASHFRNVKLVNWSGGKAGALANMYGGKSLLPPTPKGVPIYFHNYLGPNRHAKVVSARAADLLADGNAYREVSILTGNESRAAEVHNIEFPKLLDPVDDRSPATVITHVSQAAPDKLLVRGTTSDNGVVTKVLVNGHEAKATASNFAEWEVLLDGVASAKTKLTASSEDAAGNAEKQPHTWVPKF